MKLRMLVLYSLLSISVLAGQKTWNGQITDSMCGADHSGMGDMGKSPAGCAKECIKGGAQFAFVTDGKVYKIKNQDFADLNRLAGRSVSLTGDLGEDGKTLTVSKLQVR